MNHLPFTLPSISQPSSEGNPSPLVFLKLGGSLITDKNQALMPRLDTMDRLAGEVASALQSQPQIKLLLGHGAGSFGHTPAIKYGTRLGVSTLEQWRGFVEVWRVEASLNRLVIDALVRAGLPAMAFPPSAAVMARGGQVDAWELSPLTTALEAGLLPVIFGDVVFDRLRGVTILSTEDLFGYLARHLRPQRLLLAGIEPGVWADFPACTILIREITPQISAEIQASLQGSAAPDVTGGMASKVAEMLSLSKEVPDLEIRIFSGVEPGMVTKAILGQPVGTRISGSMMSS
jgi:isopentenyl phosphate kinase